MNISITRKGLSLLEVLVIIGLVIVLCSIAMPCFNCQGIKAFQTKALSNAKQIGFACRTFAVDHDGQYPGCAVIDGTTSTAQISDYSNNAFNQLFPLYLMTIQVFYQSKSAWTPTHLPDPDMGKISTANPPLPAGSNEWAYVVGLRDKSDSTFPLIANGFADLKRHAYTGNQSERGGVWKGRQAIVIFRDDSAKVMTCNPSTHAVPGSPNGADLFDTSGQTGWLNSTGTNGQNVLNPR